MLARTRNELEALIFEPLQSQKFFCLFSPLFSTRRALVVLVLLVFFGELHLDLVANREGTRRKTRFEPEHKRAEEKHRSHQHYPHARRVSGIEPCKHRWCDGPGDSPRKLKESHVTPQHMRGTAGRCQSYRQRASNHAREGVDGDRAKQGGEKENTRDQRGQRK